MRGVSAFMAGRRQRPPPSDPALALCQRVERAASQRASPASLGVRHGRPGAFDRFSSGPRRRIRPRSARLVRPFPPRSPALCNTSRCAAASAGARPDRSTA